jgi:hypothetical protein
MRRKAFLFLAAVLLGWTALAAALEIHRSRWIVDNDPWTQPSRWRFRSRHVEELRELLEAEVRDLPEGSVVAVAADPDEPGEGFFRYLWVAYLLPEYEVRHAGLGDPRVEADHWIVLPSETPHPRPLSHPLPPNRERGATAAPLTPPSPGGRERVGEGGRGGEGIPEDRE